MVDISGLDKAEVLQALFNGSRQQGMGFMHIEGATPMEIETARKIVAEFAEQNEPLSFDYLMGRVMKVNISKDEFHPGLYDRDVGDGAAERVIAKLRSAKAVA